jgi:hypothetical protein
MRPNAEKYNPSPEYLSAMFVELRDKGRTRIEVCERIGVPYRTMSDYMNASCPTQAPYSVQFILECELAWERENHPANNSSPDLDSGGYRLHNG